jgi:hypothetical protein
MIISYKDAQSGQANLIFLENEESRPCDGSEIERHI